MNQILHFICNIFSKENITFAIAITGFILSIYNFVHERRQNKMKLAVTYKNHHLSNSDQKGLNISLCIENLVKEPIAISRMYLILNSKKYEFFWIPQIIYYADFKKNNKILDEIKIHSVELPTRLEGNGVIGGFFFVKLDRIFTDEELKVSNPSITIYTNKGIQTYSIEINNPSVEI